MKWLAQIQSKIWNSSNCTSFIRLPGLNMLMFSKNVLTSFSNTFLTLEIKIKLNFSLRPWLEREGSSFRTLDLGNSWVLLTKRLSCKRYSQYMILGKKDMKEYCKYLFYKTKLSLRWTDPLHHDRWLHDWNIHINEKNFTIMYYVHVTDIIYNITTHVVDTWYYCRELWSISFSWLVISSDSMKQLFALISTSTIFRDLQFFKSFALASNR